MPGTLILFGTPGQSQIQGRFGGQQPANNKNDGLWTRSRGGMIGGAIHSWWTMEDQWHWLTTAVVGYSNGRIVA